MKLSNTPTNHILIEATTGSEWDSCDAVIVELTPAWLTAMEKRKEFVKSLIDTSIISVTYFDAPEAWILLEDDQEDIQELFGDGEKTWVFVDMEGQEIEDLSNPEQNINANLYFFKDGTFHFSGYGKHTSEEFWSSTIDITEVINALKQPA